MTAAAAGLFGALALAGVAVAVAGWRGAVPTVPGPRADAGGATRRAALAGAGFTVGLLVTRWPVAAVYVGIGVAAVPSLLRSKRDRQAAVAKVEALAAWAESLRDIMGAGAGLHQTLRTSARVAPEPIEREVRDLAARLQHQSVDTALAAFAADVAHPTADVVVASLLLANRWQAGGLPDVLTSVASTARDAAAMQQRIEGTRQRTYTQSRIVVATSFTFVVFLVVFRRQFLAPYDGFGGQIALAVIGGMFAFAAYGMYKVGRPRTPERVFGRLERAARTAPAGLRAR